MTQASEVSGRPFLAGAAVVVVALAGLLGAVVGASGQEREVPMEIAGVVLFEMTPVSMAAFGMAATAGVLALLFGLVTVAARRDAERNPDAER
ncbi:DUF7520 family protein [Halorussus amylolyticus]|uniref:DUF7520 family protein n=1 Tax=Halorussus amylolyticus TaxID=1126242 RepID=UPI0010463A3E|nr:hypothetical protein [Halorussus amylolyticus]